MSMQFRVLGPIGARVADEEIVLHGKLRKGLLTLLALSCGKVVTASRLTDDLWNGRPPPSGPDTLKSHVSLLRRDLGRIDGLVRSRSSGYLLCADPATVDALAFEEACRRGHEAARAGDHGRAVTHLDAALGLFRGPPLADLTGLDFAVREADRLDQLRLSAIEVRSESRLALGRHDEVVDELEALVHQHPLREQLAGLLMLALYRDGRQADALAVYRHVRHHLVTELGIEPGPPLQDLERRILEHSRELAPPAQPAPAPPPVPPTAGAPGRRRLPAPVRAATRRGDFIGRHRDLKLAMAAWQGARSGHAELIVIEGPPGIGKSRLAAEVAVATHADGALVLAGRCDDDQARPFQPIVECLDELGDTTAALVGALVQGSGAGHDGDRRAGLFDEVVAVLAGLAAASPVVLIVDDLQWAGTATLLLLRHVMRRFPALPLLVVATARPVTDELDGSPLDHLDRDGYLRRLPLAPLDEADARALVRPELADAPPEAEDTAVALGMGKPLLLLQLAHHAAAHRGSLPTLGNAGTGTTDAVTRIVGLRFDDLSPAARRGLATAAAIGPRFDTATLFSILGDDAFSLVDEASAARIIETASPDGAEYRFTHALLRDAAYAELSTAERKATHRRVAGALDGRATLDPARWAGDLARQLIAALPLVPPDRVVAAAHTAGDAAAAVLGFEQAAAWYRTALDLATTWGAVDRSVSCDLWLALGRTQVAAGAWIAARDAYAQAAELARELDDPARLAAAALGYRGDYQGTSGLDPHLEHLLLDALDRLPPDELDLRARLTAQLAVTRFNAMGPDIDALAGRALDLARRSGHPAALVAGLHARHTAMWHPTTAGERRALSEEMIATAIRAGDTAGAQIGRWNLILDLLDQGRLDQALDVLHHYRTQATRAGRGVDQWWAALLGATTATAQDRLAEAEDLANDAFERGAPLAPDDAALFLSVQLFAIRWAQGRLHELLPFVDEQSHHDPPLPGLDAGRAVILLESGRADEAAELARRATHPDALDAVRRDRIWPGVVTLWAHVVSACDMAEPARRIRELLEPCAGLQVVMGPGWSVLGPVSLWLARLAATTGDPAADSWRLQAEDEAVRWGTPGWARRAADVPRTAARATL